MRREIAADMPEWWNWQTCRTQNPVVAIPCGFDPRFRHQQKDHLSTKTNGLFWMMFAFGKWCWLCQWRLRLLMHGFAAFCGKHRIIAARSGATSFWVQQKTSYRRRRCITLWKSSKSYTKPSKISFYSPSYALINDNNPIFICLRTNGLVPTKAPLCKGRLFLPPGR